MARQIGVARSQRVAMAVLLALIAVAGCSITGHGHRVGQAKQPSTTPVSATSAINCGHFKVINGPHPGGVSAAGWTCFANAIRARKVGILHLALTSVEGNPVFTTFTSRADGRVDVVTDSSQDPFSSGGKHTQTCTGLDPDPAARRLLFFKFCTPVT